MELSVYSEENSKNIRFAGPDNLLTAKVQVSEFGHYVEELHANGDNVFRDQFYVSCSRLALS